MGAVTAVRVRVRRREDGFVFRWADKGWQWRAGVPVTAQIATHVADQFLTCVYPHSDPRRRAALIYRVRTVLLSVWARYPEVRQLELPDLPVSLLV